jgi:hypothetical protein
MRERFMTNEEASREAKIKRGIKREEITNMNSL